MEHPVYHFKALGITATLNGADEVKAVYSMWAQTNQSIFYSDDEEVAVADSYVATVATGSQQVLGSALVGYGIHVDDEDAMYIYKAREEMIWTYDARGRLTGEDVWEPDSDKAEIIKLDPTDVLTTREAALMLEPLIMPLPSFDDMVIGTQPAST